MSVQGMKTERLYPAGTVLSCPADNCSLGLYKVVESTSFEDLVVFDHGLINS
jgi:hypothetical protein